MKKRDSNKIFLIISIILMIISIIIFIVSFNFKIIKNTFINYGLNIYEAKIIDNDVFTKKVNVKLKLDKNLFNYKISCASKDKLWIGTNKQECYITINSDDKYFYLKNKNKIKKIYVKDYFNKILDITIPDKKIYLIPNETYIIKPNVQKIGEFTENIIYNIQDSSIAKVNNKGTVNAIKDGTTIIDIKDKNGEINTKLEVIVTSLVVKAKIDNKKSFLPCNRYNNSEAKLLDEILEYKVNKAGYKTRAGVVAAARFLSMEFPYRLNYFLENGRLTMTDKKYVDGEGRFYHKGLYLSNDKFSLLSKTRVGPAIWGCKLRELSYDGRLMSNGLDCSGFVTWTLLNGGFDVGDLGAPLWIDNNSKDVGSLGEKIRLTKEFVNSKNIKAGDLATCGGHAAIVVGVDDKNVYIAEELYHNVGLTVLTFTYNDLLEKSLFTHIIKMDKFYSNDGNYQAMW